MIALLVICVASQLSQRSRRKARHGFDYLENHDDEERLFTGH